MKLTELGIEYFKKGLRILYSDKNFKVNPSVKKEIEYTRNGMNYAIDCIDKNKEKTTEIESYNNQVVNTIDDLIKQKNKDFREEFKINYLANYIINSEFENSQLYNCAYEQTLSKFK